MAWLNWKDVEKRVENRQVAYWGRSEDWVPKCIPHVNAALIVDNNPAYHGQLYLGIPVKIPSVLDGIEVKPFVIITTHDFLNVADILESYGYVSGIDFCFCPEYRDFSKLAELREHSFCCIFTSGDYKSGKATRTSHFGGGIFKGAFNGKDDMVTQLVEGQYRGLIKIEDQFIAVEYNACEIHFFDSEFNIERKISLPRPHFCGLAFDADSELLYVANASTDEIYGYSLDGECVKTIPFGAYSSSDGKSRYHINDIDISDGSLFVSYFSESGYWKNDVFDGGVVAIDLKADNRATLYRDLWQPHSPKIINGNLYVLDSFRGRLLSRSNESVGEFPGFVRGLFYSSGLFYVAQSETMYMSRKKGLSKNIMNNAGIWVLDDETCGTRFYSCNGICNIHSIYIL